MPELHHLVPGRSAAPVEVFLESSIVEAGYLKFLIRLLAEIEEEELGLYAFLLDVGQHCLLAVI